MKVTGGMIISNHLCKIWCTTLMTQFLMIGRIDNDKWITVPNFVSVGLKLRELQRVKVKNSKMNVYVKFIVKNVKKNETIFDSTCVDSNQECYLVYTCQTME